jgi:hypothetical protein
VTFSIDQLPTYQEIALGLLDVATDGAKGRPESDPVYKRITENRDFGAGYSSCGDLCHWLLFRLGVRLPFINRNEAGVWKTGLNISRLVWNASMARGTAAGEIYEPGDILAIWNKPSGTDAHVLVVRSHTDGKVHSSDYGQPGGAQRVREMTGRVLGDRVVMRVLKLRDVLRIASDQGALTDYQTAEYWLTGGHVA